MVLTRIWNFRYLNRVNNTHKNLTCYSFKLYPLINKWQTQLPSHLFTNLIVSINNNNITQKHNSICVDIVTVCHCRWYIEFFYCIFLLMHWYRIRLVFSNQNNEHLICNWMGHINIIGYHIDRNELVCNARSKKK